jgi:2-phospho-L-lactate/phosphoenolpyruvate guanylyltransferase
VSSITEPGSGWTVVLPLKGGPTAKSRLRAPAVLATAIALDCLDVVLAAPGVATVVVVTADPVLAASATAAGARVQPESRPGRGLPAAVQDGLNAAQGRCAVLLGDLPALRTEDLATALQRAAAVLAPEPSPDAPQPPSMAFVPDAENTGTVLLTALTATAMRPSFGPGSAAAHQTAGARRLDLDLPRLRRDVDTPADLRTAVEFGVGPRTRAALAEIAV